MRKDKIPGTLYRIGKRNSFEGRCDSLNVDGMGVLVDAIYERN